MADSVLISGSIAPEEKSNSLAITYNNKSLVQQYNYDHDINDYSSTPTNEIPPLHFYIHEVINKKEETYDFAYLSGQIFLVPVSRESSEVMRFNNAQYEQKWNDFIKSDLYKYYLKTLE